MWCLFHIARFFWGDEIVPRYIRDYSRQIIFDLTRPGPPKVAEEGTSPYFKEIWVGEIL